MSKTNRTRLAVIGGGVGLATAGVIALLVFKGKPETEETTELSARAAAVPALPDRDIEGGVVKPWDVKPPTAEELKELAEAEKIENDEMAKEVAKAEAAVRKARADDALAESRRVGGILGSTALTQGGAFASLTGTGDISSGFDDTNIYGGLVGNQPGTPGTGLGFGRSGFGPGGGGTGWGTIGTGNYGTIGRGSGGSGYGVGGGRGGMRGRASAVPVISIGQPTVAPTVANAADPGVLDKAIIRRYVRRNIQKLQYCYEKELLAKPTLQGGTVSTQFTITDVGAVGSASASGVDPSVSSCMAQVIKGIEFPKPKGTGGVTVSYPFTVRPSGP